MGNISISIDTECYDTAALGALQRNCSGSRPSTTPRAGFDFLIQHLALIYMSIHSTMGSTGTPRMAPDTHVYVTPCACSLWQTCLKQNMLHLCFLLCQLSQRAAAFLIIIIIYITPLLSLAVSRHSLPL